MNLSIKDTLYKGHLSNEDTVCCPKQIELCTNLPLNKGHLSIQDRKLDPNGVLYREVPLYYSFVKILYRGMQGTVVPADLHVTHPEVGVPTRGPCHV